MQIYIAGKWSEKPRIRQQMDELEALGYSITFDWTNFEKEGDDDNKKAQAGIYDIEGVRNADLIIINMEDPNYAYRGTFCELGCALGLRKRIMLLCPDQNATCREQPFFHHPSIEHYESWQELLKKIEN